MFSGVFSEDFFKQLLISGIQTGVYFEHAFFVDSDNTFRKYFELTRPPVDFLRQSQAHYSMAAALEEIAEHILFLSGVQPISDSSNRWNKFISRFSKIVRDLNDLFHRKEKVVGVLLYQLYVVVLHNEDQPLNVGRTM